MKRAPLFIGSILLLVSLGVFGWVTDAPAYLGHQPSTCNNCHVMDSQYENWAHAGHSQAAVCTDCHLPHQNLLSYYIYKGYSGMKDVLSFTLKTYPDALRASRQTDAILQANCIRCHGDTVDAILTGAQPFSQACWSCHRSVAHGPRGSTLAAFQDSQLYPSAWSEEPAVVSSKSPLEVPTK